MELKTALKTARARTKTAPIVIVLFLALIGAILFSLAVGRYGIKLSDLSSILSHKLFGTAAAYEAAAETVLIKVRTPRILAAIAIGMALSTAGATYQGLFRNPMVSPDLLGASSGACLGASVSLLFDASLLQVQINAFVCGMAAVLLTYAVSNVVGRGNSSTLTLVLTGMVVTSLCNAMMTITKLVADPNSKLAEITFWLMGGLASIGLEDLPMLLLPILVGIIPMILLRYRLNVLAFGEDEAKALGVNVKAIRAVFIVSATLVTSASVAASGMIGWIGLVIPHLARMIAGPNYKKLLPVAMLLGGVYLLLVDNISRCLFAVEIPLGMLTALIGAPFFLYLLMRGRRGWA